MLGMETLPVWMPGADVGGACLSQAGGCVSEKFLKARCLSCNGRALRAASGSCHSVGCAGAAALLGAGLRDTERGARSLVGG